jgi:NAD-dependent deacetylase
VPDVAAWIADAQRIVALTGAGISTESGIPDYRGPDGLWTKNPAAARLFDINAYLSDPEVRREAWLERMHHPAWLAEPSAGHHALVELERAGTLLRLATQNIDGLHREAGTSPDVLLELHGTIWRCRCLECGYETSMQSQLDRVRAGDQDPRCLMCGGIQRSATVAFGQALDRSVLLAAFDAAGECDLFLAVGSSLTVQPAARLCEVAKHSGARLVIINAEPTPYDGLADAVISARIGEILPSLAIRGRAPGPDGNAG